MPVVAGAARNSTKRLELARRAEGAAPTPCSSSRRTTTSRRRKPLPALQGDQLRYRHSDHHLQHPARSVIDMSSRRWRVVRAQEYRRREGRDRQFVRVCSSARHGRGIQPTLRRGRDLPRVHGPRRARCISGDGNVAPALRRIPERLPARRLQGRAHAAGQADAAAHNLFIETNPAPANTRCLSSASVRHRAAAVVPLSDKSKTAVREASARGPDQLNSTDRKIRVRLAAGATPLRA